MLDVTVALQVQGAVEVEEERCHDGSRPALVVIVVQASHPLHLFRQASATLSQVPRKWSQGAFSTLPPSPPSQEPANLPPDPLTLSHWAWLNLIWNQKVEGRGLDWEDEEEDTHDAAS